MSENFKICPQCHSQVYATAEKCYRCGYLFEDIIEEKAREVPPIEHAVPMKQELSKDRPVQDPELIDLIKKQTELLESIHHLYVQTLEKKGDYNSTRSRILDIDMSISSMVVLSLKWLVASIPVGIVIGLFYLIIIAIFGGF